MGDYVWLTFLSPDFTFFCFYLHSYFQQFSLYLFVLTFSSIGFYFQFYLENRMEKVSIPQSFTFHVLYMSSYYILFFLLLFCLLISAVSLLIYQNNVSVIEMLIFNVINQSLIILGDFAFLQRRRKENKNMTNLDALQPNWIIISQVHVTNQ